jgi:hypothetical protein
MGTTGERIKRRSSIFGTIVPQLAVLALTVAMGTVVAAPKAEAAPGSSIDRAAFLRAIAEVETGGNSGAVGRHGERGMYQFNRTTWRLHTSRSFHDAHIGAVSSEIAARHFSWIHEGLVKAGQQPTPYLMAAAWNAGLGRVTNGRLPSTTKDYAARVANIVSATPRPARPAMVATASSSKPVQRAAAPVMIATAVTTFRIGEVEAVEEVMPVVPVEVAEPVLKPLPGHPPRFVIALIE